MANVAYNVFKKGLLDNTFDLLNDTVKVMLVTSSYTANADHQVVDDGASATSARPGQNEISGTGYTAGFAGSGRKTLASKTVTEDDTNDRGVFTAANLTWSTLGPGTGDPARAIVYRHLTNDASSYLIAGIDGGFPVTPNGGDVNLNWNASGILYVG